MSKRLLGEASVYLAASVLNAGVPFLLLPILTRVLTPRDYGTVAMFGIVVSVLSAFTGLNVQGSVAIRYYRCAAEELARYVGTCFAIIAASTIALLGLVLLFGHQLESLSQLPRAWLLVAILTSAAQVTINLRLSLWQVRHEAVRYGVFQVLQSALNGGLSLLCVLVFAMTWRGRVLGQVVATVLFMAIALGTLLARREILAPKGADDAREALRFGLPLIPHVLGALAIAATDRVIIANLLDVAQAGIYMVALQIGMVLGLVTDSCNKAYAPWLLGALGQPDSIRDRRVVFFTYLYFAALGSVATLLGLVAPPLLSLLVGEQFRSASGAVLYIAWGFAFGGMYLAVTNYVFFAGKTGILAWITCVSGAFNIAATFWLIERNGVAGAAQAFMLSQALLFFGTWWLSHKVHPMPWFPGIRSDRLHSSSPGE